ncbi:MAG: FxLYD domain-containing protein, partial [Chloroflexota bacterium]
MAKNNTNLQIALIVLTLLIFSMSCSFVTNALPELDTPAEAPTAPPSNPTAVVPSEVPPTAIPTQAPAPSGLNVTEITFFQDDFDNWVVSGLVTNNTDRAIDNIEIEITALNASGDSIYAEVVTATLYATSPNEISPFDTTIWEELPDLDHFTGTIVGQSYAEVERGEIDIRGVVFTISDDGSYAHVSGEIANNGDEPVNINSLAGAIFDTGGNLISTNGSTDLVRFLYPGETSPFRVSIAAPPTRRGEISDYVLYTDVRLDSEEDDYEISFLEEYNFVDGEGNVHLVGELRNDSDISLNISIVAGIYDADNNVFDADTLSLALYSLDSGETLTYDFDGWEPLNDTLDLLDQADNYTVQWDPYWTWESSTDYITISTSNDAYEYDDFFQEMIFTG